MNDQGEKKFLMDHRPTRQQYFFLRLSIFCFLHTHHYKACNRQRKDPWNKEQWQEQQLRCLQEQMVCYFPNTGVTDTGRPFALLQEVPNKKGRKEKHN